MWVTGNGTVWHTIVLPGPRNAQLNQIATAGQAVAATGGTDGQGTGTPAFAVISHDGGAAWQPAQLPLPAPGTVVTALAGGQQGFTAAGVGGQPTQVIIWQLSSSGSAWTQAHVAGTDHARTVSALGTDAAGTVTGIGPAADGSLRAATFSMPGR